MVGDDHRDFYDMLVIGEPDSDGPTHFSVTGGRGTDAVTFAEGTVSSWDAACRRAEIEARRASIRLIAGVHHKGHPGPA